MTLMTQTPGNERPMRNRKLSRAALIMMVTIGAIVLCSAMPARALAQSSTSARASALVDQIDSFGFDTRMSMGAGGFLTVSVYPVVLFRSGEALTKIDHLLTASNIAALGVAT